MKVSERHLKSIFFEEASIILEDIERCLLVLESNQANNELHTKIARLIHNLKGGSGAVGFSILVDFCHHLETLLLIASINVSVHDKAFFTLLFDSKDHLIQMLEAYNKDIEQNNFSHKLLIKRIKKYTKNNRQNKKVQNKKNKRESSFIPLYLNSAESIRIPLSKMQKLTKNVEDLIALQTIFQSAMQKKDIDGLNTANNHLSVLSNELYDLIAKIRKVPIRVLATKIQRVIRDTAKVLNKEVKLKISGVELEIDQSIFQQINDSLLHIIRNAIDHGIESKEERIKKDKNPIGTILIDFSYNDKDLIISVSDDGKGLDLKQIKEKAIKEQIIKPEDSLKLENIQNIIFHPGFTTKKTANTLSGRGVGLDVVKASIDSMGGSVLINSDEDIGCSFYLKIPIKIENKKTVKNKAS